MNNSFFIKNGLVLTLDGKNRTGYFNIAVRNGKITGIEPDLSEEDFLRSVPDAEVIDASGKIIMPGFLNAAINSTYSLNKIFFKKCSYENLSNNVPLRLVKKFLSNPSNKNILKQLFDINHLRSLRNGEIFINETSPVISKDFYESYMMRDAPDKMKQRYCFAAFDNFLSSLCKEKNDPFIIGYKPADDINNYSLSSIKKLIKPDADSKSIKPKLYLEVSQSHNNVEALRNVFGKPFIEVLGEFDLLSDDTMLFNPVFLTNKEINILKENNVNLIFSPSDFLKFSNKPFDPVEFFSSGLNIMIGTGLQGKDVLSELKIMSTLLHKYSFPYEKIIRLATTNIAKVFSETQPGGLPDLTGIIEKNKSADMIFFTLNDIRNLLTLPEIDVEKLCEFIIEELSVKDISDVIVKGNFVVKNGKELFNKDYITKADEVADKLYEEGKYFEFKEKYLRRKRVDEVSLNKKVQPVPGDNIDIPDDAFADNFDTDQLRDEGEFRVIGKKFTDDLNRRIEENIKGDYSNIPDAIHSLSEISSLDEGFNLMEEEPEMIKEEHTGKNLNGKEDFNLYEEKIQSKESQPAQHKKKKEAEVTFKKDKLKFGFSDEE